MSKDEDWDDNDLALLQSMAAAGDPIERIAKRLDRTIDETEPHLAVVQLRAGAVPIVEPDEN